MRRSCGSWALRRTGGRSRTLNEAALKPARRPAASEDPSRRWVGKDVLRDPTRPLARSRLARRAR